MTKPLNPRFAELHAHSAYSFLDGASTPAELVAEAVRCGLSGLAITDHDGLQGAVQFAQAAQGAGLPTVFGSELHLPTPEGVRDLPTGVEDPRAQHLLVLARSPQGYQRLSHSIGVAYLRGGSKGQLRYDIEELAEAAHGEWLVLTGCRKGAVRQSIERMSASGQVTWNIEGARTELDKLVSLFGRGNVAVELTDNGDPLDSARCDTLASLAKSAGLPTVATGNVHYATPRDADLAAVLASVRARKDLDGMDGWLPSTPTAHLRTPAEMYLRHRKRPQAVATAAALADECAFDLSLVKPRLPPHDVPEGHTEATWLRELTMRGAQKRYGDPTNERIPGAYAQLEHELKIITDLEFPGYFLIVHDLVEFCRARGILAQGRGSAANSAVCFALGITAIDAVAHGLLFERFLAPERDGPPDIDVDIESVRREEVIQYVYEKFGRMYAAQVANVISYKPRSAVRDAARALGYGPGQQDAWSKQVERWHMPTINPQNSIPEDVISMATRMAKLPRHLGIHSGGMVICDRPIIDVCPVEWARTPGRTVLQWDKEDCADAGLVKFDLLGLGMLTALRYAFEFVKEHEGIELELHSLPQEDPAVYDLLCAADTVGVFQVESRAQMATLPRLQPRCFYDIVVEVALIRPGPIQGRSVHPYIERSRGRQKITFTHPLLERSLTRTKGVPLFQEQLMQMAIDAAGFSAVEADQLRRAIGSKRSVERMEALKERLFEGMAENGIVGSAAEEIYNQLKSFADFGFPESHAYSFAYLVYASSWLKVHHPAAFYAALLAAQPMGFYSPQSLVADARRHGITVLRPDVQQSGIEAVVENISGELGVRLGLAPIRQVGASIATRIVEEREKFGIFADLTDLARRVDINAVQWEGLASAEALVGFDVDRRQALWNAGPLARENPETLPGLVGVEQPPTLPLLSDVEVAAIDVWATGVSVDSYPTEHARAALTADGVLTVAQVMIHESDRRVMVAGVVTHRQRPGTAAGVTFLSLEDETGILNVVCTVGLWKRFRGVAQGSAALVVRGRIERADGATNLVAEYLRPLSLKVSSTSRDFR